MGMPRLQGWTVEVARALCEGGPLLAIVREQMRRAHGIAKLAALPPKARAPMAESQLPIAAKVARQWPEQELAGVPPVGRETALSLRTAYLREETTPEEVVRRLRVRVEGGAFGECLNSPFIAYDWEVVEAEARDSTQRYRAGRQLSPLDGIPVPIKDHVAMRGVPLQSGSSFTRISDTDAALVTALRRGGALLFAKSHTAEWGFSPLGTNAHHAMPHNPYARNRGAGGSSTGAAAAIALGLSPVAHASDAGGSIRIPAALCGLYGLKPTYQRISRVGDLWGENTISHNGPIGRSVQDLVDFLTVACVRDPREPAQAGAPDWPHPAPAWWKAVGRGVQGCRIGVVRWGFEGASPAIAAGCERALDALAREGAELVDVDIPLIEHSPAVGAAVLASEVLAGLLDFPESHGAATGAEVRLQLQIVRSMALEDVLAAHRMRPKLRSNVAQALAQVDVLALPSCLSTAPVFRPEEDRSPILDDDATRGLARNCLFGNLTGLPAGVAPVGADAGLPFALQIIGDAWDEASVVAVLAQLERMGVGALPAPAEYAVLGLLPHS